MRRAALVLLTAWWALGLTAARPAAAAAADHLTITTVVANMQAGALFTVQVEARDGSGAVDSGFTGGITLHANAIGGSDFSTGNVVSAVAGVATFDVSLNNAANGYAITATASGLISAVSNSFSVTATHLAVLTVANVRAGDPFNATVQARDANNNRAENFAGSVSLDASATGGSNFVGGTVDVSASSGTANIFGLMLDNAADGYSLSASSAGLASAVSNSFAVTARRLVTVNVVPNHQAGTLFNVNVEARDNNNAVAENFTGNVTLHADADRGGSNFSGGPQIIAATAGTANFTNLALNNAANNYSVTASAFLVASGFGNNFNVTATHLAVSAVTSVRSGAPFTVTVEARDANNNLAENFTGSVDLDAAATGGSNFVGGTRSVPAAAGTATFANLVLNNAADGYLASAGSAGLTSGLSNSFDVTAGQLVIVNVVPNHQAGTLFNVAVEARDGNNAVAENFTGNVTLDAAAPVGGSNFNGGPQNSAATAGTANFTNLALDNAADGYTITATATGLSDGVSNAFNVTPGKPDISIDDVSVTEGNAGTTTATFTVTLSRPASNVATVDYTTAGASATSGTDFVGGTGTLTFAPGVTSQSIAVTVNGDPLNETDEMFVVNLTGAVNGVLADAQGVGTIRNDDPLPAISAQPVMAVEGSSAPRAATLTVRLSVPSGQQIRVNFQTADGAAVDGVGENSPDYTASTGTLVFAPGETQRTVTVALRNDLAAEADEYFFVDLRTPVNATVATPRTKVTIVDDDSPVRQLVALGVQVLTLDIDIRKVNLLENVRLDCNSLRAFTRDVTRYRGTYIAPADADALLAAANRLRADIGCRP
jgi:hypothetical protein